MPLNSDILKMVKDKVDNHKTTVKVTGPDSNSKFTAFIMNGSGKPEPILNSYPVFNKHKEAEEAMNGVIEFVKEINVLAKDEISDDALLQINDLLAGIK